MVVPNQFSLASEIRVGSLRAAGPPLRVAQIRRLPWGSRSGSRTYCFCRRRGRCDRLWASSLSGDPDSPLINDSTTFLTPQATIFSMFRSSPRCCICSGATRALTLRRPEGELELLHERVSFSFTAAPLGEFVLFKSVVFSRYALVEW